MLRASVGQGLRAFAGVGSWGAAPAAVALRIARGALSIPVGGSSVAGSMGYVRGARELAAQIRAGELPEPDVCVVALGSGGTAAGLAAGFEAEGLRTKVVGACISVPPWALRLVARRLTRTCAGLAGAHASPSALRARLSVDVRFLGAGYAEPTTDGADAARDALEHAGLELDPTYTAKAFACALWHVRARRAEHVLYWHTLSSAPMAPLLDTAPTRAALDPRLLELLERAASER